MSEEPQKNSTWNTLKETTWLQRFAILAVIGFMIYLNQSTKMVPNFNNSTNTHLYTEQTPFVPKSGVSNSQMAFGIILFILCLFILLATKISELRRATPKEAMDDLSRQIKELKNVPLLDGTTIPLTDSTKIEILPIFFTRYLSVGTERKEFRYVFSSIIKDHSTELEHYHNFWYEPWKRLWDGFYPTTGPLSGKDRCPNCGNESDLKYITEETLKSWFRIRKEVSGQGGMIK